VPSAGWVGSRKRENGNWEEGFVVEIEERFVAEVEERFVAEVEERFRS
jgi:hypothetical protein